MAATMKDLRIDRLAPAERIALALEIWESLGEARPPGRLTAEQRPSWRGGTPNSAPTPGPLRCPSALRTSNGFEVPRFPCRRFQVSQGRTVSSFTVSTVMNQGTSTFGATGLFANSGSNQSCWPATMVSRRRN